MAITELAISQIRLDGDTQPRAALDFEAVEDYCDLMQAGVKFPPVTVYFDGKHHWLADGFHRREAAFGAGFDKIECDVRSGSVEDARWHSFGANRSHGLRRTRRDLERAVKLALAHPKAAEVSDNQLAEHVGVSPTTIGSWRKQLSGANGNLQSTKRRGRDGRTINTARIGKRKAKPKASPSPEPIPAETEAPPDGSAVIARLDAALARLDPIEGGRLLSEAAAAIVDIPPAIKQRAEEIKNADPEMFERIGRGEIELDDAYRQVFERESEPALIRTDPAPVAPISITAEAHETVRVVIEAATRIVEQARQSPPRRSRILGAVPAEQREATHRILLRAAHILQQLAAPLVAERKGAA